MTTSPSRLAVLASGNGSNLQAIYDDLKKQGPSSGVELALVVSDRKAAGALERARTWGVPALHVPKDDSAALAGSLAGSLAEHGITHIALAGYLKLIPLDVVRAFAGKMINVHPALLPAFGGPGMYGSKVHAAVIAAGAQVSGPTVHFVSEHYDEGAIIAQWPVPVHATDSADTLAARVLAVEHKLYPLCVRGVASGHIVLGPDGRVHGAGLNDFDGFDASPISRQPFAS